MTANGFFLHRSTWFFLCLGALSLPLDAATRPNIIIVLADDLGYGDLGCYNAQSRIPTPHMDRLAKDGIRCNDAHAAASICTPSRYAVVTGRYCWRSKLKRGVLFNYEPPLIKKGRATIATLLQKEGYTTAMVGKWHLGLRFATRPGAQIDFDRPFPWYSGPDPDPKVGASINFSAPVTGGPRDLGFDYAYYTAGCSTDQEPFCFIENKTFLGMERATYRRPDGSWRAGMAAPAWINETVDVTFTEKAIRFIETSHVSARAKPFFLYLALSAPHSPHLVPDFARGKSRAGVRGDMVWLVDWCVGQITKALDALALTDNTLLIVTSDNGPLRGSLEPGAGEGSARISNGHRSAGSLRGYKASIFEGGHRVPFLAKWPGQIAPGTTAHTPIGLVDLLATCAAIAGADVPRGAGEDSVNRLPALRGRRDEARVAAPMVHHSGGDSYAVRDGRWKIIFRQLKGTHRARPTSGKGYLYDLRSDPFERNDVWNCHPDVVARLTRLMQAYEREAAIGTAKE